MNTFDKTLIPQQVMIQNKLIYTGQKSYINANITHMYLFSP